MRQVLFAVVLVAASFAGGAVVNGPGLRWAQSAVLGRLGMVEDESDTDGATAPAPAEGAIPGRPIPPLVVGPDATGSDDATKPVAGLPTPAPAPEPEPASTPEPRRALAGEPGTLPGLAPVPEAEAAAAATAATETATATDMAPLPLDPPAPLTTSREREQAALELAAAAGEKADREATAPPDRDPGVRPASLPDDPASAASAPTSAPGDPTDWAGVRAALRALGVSRYGTEGEPGGRVRFHCVIPLAGRRAVGQHFEAEGDDDLQAARAALRRVALWRATETTRAAK